MSNTSYDNKTTASYDSKSTASKTEAKAKDVVGNVKAKASEMVDDVSRVAKENSVQISDAARNLASGAKGKVEEAVSQRKSLGADYIGSLADATDQAADAFETNLPQAAQYIRQAAGQIHGVADTVRNRDVRELFGEAQQFARRQPTLVFAGAVILGFAALRFLKSAPPAATNTSVNNTGVRNDIGNTGLRNDIGAVAGHQGTNHAVIR